MDRPFLNLSVQQDQLRLLEPELEPVEDELPPSDEPEVLPPEVDPAPLVSVDDPEPMPEVPTPEVPVDDEPVPDEPSEADEALEPPAEPEVIEPLEESSLALPLDWLEERLSLTRRLFWTCFTPETASARSSAWRLLERLSTVPDSVTSPPLTSTSISDASRCWSSAKRSDTSSRSRSSERA